MDNTKKSDNTPIEVSSVADFTKWVDELGGGEILFRGMANAAWDVESSLYRRLQHNKVKKDDAYGLYQNIFVEMVKILISRSRRNGHDIENGRELKDLELLAKLQHYGAATCLIDFTKNSLVALYFACALVDKEDDNNADGKVVAFNSDNANFCDEISIKNFDKEIEHWFKEYEKNKKIWILSPKKLGNRIVSQQSVFVFGNPTLPTENFHICKITNKKTIMADLKRYGISAETLFDDFVGFSAQNSYNKEYDNWDTDSPFMSGLICYVTGDYKSAIKYYDKEINFNPKNWIAYHSRGIAKTKLRNFQDAVDDYDDAINLNSKDSTTYNNRGFAKFNLGNYQNAINDYDKAIILNPKDYEAYYNRGLAKFTLEKFQDAINDYNEAIKLNFKDPEAYYNRGLAKFGLGEFQDAINDFDEAIKLNPKSLTAYNNRGLAKFYLRKFQDAINDYDEAIRLNPKYLTAYNNRGLAKGNLSKFQDAINDFDEAIKLDSKDGRTYNNRGSAKYSWGKFQDAINDFNEAIRLNSKDFLAYNNRGLAKYKLGKFQDAISEFNEAINLNPNYLEAYCARVLTKYKLGDKEGASADFAKAKELNPKLNMSDLLSDNPDK